LDVATPLIGSLANRFENADYWSWRELDSPPLIRFGQEVRPSLGHTGLIGDETFFWPWTYGAGTQLYAHDDVSNIDPLSHTQRGRHRHVHTSGAGDWRSVRERCEPCCDQGFSTVRRRVGHSSIVAGICVGA
jgi:hypothetical protein